MLTTDDVADCEGDALLAYEEAELDPERPPPIEKLCEKLFGTRPLVRPGLVREACMGILDGEVRIYSRSGLSLERRRFAVAHEISHGRSRTHHNKGGAAVEARADLLAACLLAPRPAFLKMVKKCGHSIYDLAHAFSTTQATAMLRLGEVVGRPVRLLGPRERIRGEAFVWPDVKKALRGDLRHIVHPVRLADEKRWGLMASA